MIHAKIMGNNNVTADFAVRMVRGMGSLYGGPQWTSCFHHSSMTLNNDNKKLDKLEQFSLRIPGAQSLLLDIWMVPDYDSLAVKFRNYRSNQI